MARDFFSISNDAIWVAVITALPGIVTAVLGFISHSKLSKVAEAANSNGEQIAEVKQGLVENTALGEKTLTAAKQGREIHGDLKVELTRESKTGVAPVGPTTNKRTTAAAATTAATKKEKK